MAKQICGICGSSEPGEGGFCKACGGDHWVEPLDFDNPQLKRYLKTACTNLKCSLQELKEKVSL